ncbi:MAG: hypothetical protein Q4D13_04625 [Erysipelotrichaceae bacterium]|nr:hypothetical protein [Erysipelotrichaceae bacterium]
MEKQLNIKYIILQGLFWSYCCVATGFVSLCLLSRSLSNQEIGIVIATFGV